MKICLPTHDDRGFDARLSDHFGSAPFLTFVDTGSGACEVLANPGRCHEPGDCHPVAELGARAVRAVVCRGLGRRALEGLRRSGLEVFVTRETTARGAVEAFARGRLVPMGALAACAGHGDCGEPAPGDR
jgi:predicted Fe-Mo cluster-binding NifX family protein